MWFSAHQYVQDTPELSQFSPTWGNNCFTLGRADGRYKILFNKGVEKILISVQKIIDDILTALWKIQYFKETFL